MNKLILIGNGFDLAHNLKTKYSDFILWYLKKCWNTALSYDEFDVPSGLSRVYSDKLIEITFNTKFKKNSFSEISALTLDDFIKISQNIKDDKTGYLKAKLGFKSLYFKRLIEIFKDIGWADIEYEYFNFLIKKIGIENNREIISLNDEFDNLKVELQEYLSLQERKILKLETIQEIYPLLNYSYNFSRKQSPIDLNSRILILNFNYTSTPEKYLDENSHIIYIHGKLNDNKNHLIFGFGDEVSENYKNIENQNNNELFKHIKSFNYFKTDNYSRIIDFLQFPFEVNIMGLSCGISDRTLLSTIFQNENCKFVKVFFYESLENYLNITYNLSRHFRDKASMRSKVLNFELCEKMPQRIKNKIKGIKSESKR